MPGNEIEAAALARVIREQTALPLTDREREELARAIETSADDEEFLANALVAVRLISDQLEHSTSDVTKRTTRSD